MGIQNNINKLFIICQYIRGNFDINRPFFIILLHKKENRSTQTLTVLFNFNKISAYTLFSPSPLPFSLFPLLSPLAGGGASSGVSVLGAEVGAPSSDAGSAAAGDDGIGGR